MLRPEEVVLEVTGIPQKKEKMVEVNIQEYYMDILGHSLMVQFRVSKEGPRSSHPIPPCAGFGFVHDLVRC